MIIKRVGAKAEFNSHDSIPDLWHIAMELHEAGRFEISEAILEVWHKCHIYQQYVNKEFARNPSDFGRVMEVIQHP